MLSPCLAPAPSGDEALLAGGQSSPRGFSHTEAKVFVWPLAVIAGKTGDYREPGCPPISREDDERASGRGERFRAGRGLNEWWRRTRRHAPCSRVARKRRARRGCRRATMVSARQGGGRIALHRTAGLRSPVGGAASMLRCWRIKRYQRGLGVRRHAMRPAAGARVRPCSGQVWPQQGEGGVPQPAQWRTLAQRPPPSERRPPVRNAGCAVAGKSPRD